MAKRITSFEFVVDGQPPSVGRSRWLHGRLREAILAGRLRAGTRLPSSRDFARQYGLARGTVVGVFEQLRADGFVSARRGAGTWVDVVPESTRRIKPLKPFVSTLPSPLTGLDFPPVAAPFRCYEPALDDFPMSEWARLASRQLRRASTGLLALRNGRGHPHLREVLADYLTISRGAACDANRIVIVTGIQQALDILARTLLKPGDSVWMEDPGYFGAVVAFRSARATIIPVPVDDEGLSVARGRKLAPRARGIYLTPAHQFPLGVTMTLRRRLELLDFAQSRGMFVIEDDYDGAYRFAGRPVSALQSLDKAGSVILLGSFNKILFPALRVGYMVLPEHLVDTVVQFRFGLDQSAVGLEQAVLAEFIERGHLGRHIRHTRARYAERLGVLEEQVERQLHGVMELSSTRAGLYTLGFLRNRMTSRQAESAARAYGVETMAIDRFALGRRLPAGLLLGFAPFDRRAIERGVAKLAAALTEQPPARATGPERAAHERQEYTPAVFDGGQQPGRRRAPRGNS